MAKREVLHVKGSNHQNPIPTAVKIGNMVYTSAIIGSDPETGKMPETVEEEVANLFYYMREIMELAGGSVDDIAHLSVLVTDREYKKVVNVEWLKMFPDENNRPARHTTVDNLRDGLRVQVEMTAVL
ncbi:RidA family protein [Alicyclobacillus fastidiosus]|uniref:RidA family protein n=1 Tax=Alicyclobacillus fastidiosus TaxID=392011 RepID=A0ABY6ZEG2_9BACL|nr:RidA family protein [Alicyclobacillus fastidiosus]WAH41280.1 RidA family protein [Alicyclobacillus fastidiosus]GMA62877.1 enamine deaminase RidA [Alicyclobacillus fastidiosus]